MTNVRANCRERFTADDLDFVAASLSERSRGSTTLPNDLDAPRSTLVALLAEPEALDAALESDRLLKALLETPGNLPVSPQFYFYVLTRHMLLRFDRDVADYVASVLAGFAVEQASRLYPMNRMNDTGETPVQLSDMLIALKSASSEKEFMIRVQVGNYSLFMSGIFPQHIAHRSTHHASPPLSFYEEVGSQNYRRASDHRLAKQHALADVYRTMADHFTDVRHGLNQMSDRLLCLEGMP